MPTLAPADSPALPAELATTVEAARSYRRASKAKNTRRGYASDLRGFAAWAHVHGLATLPADPATIGLYIAHLATTGRKASTISRAVAAISISHKEAGLPNPCTHPEVVAILAGIRREIGIAPNRKTALTLARLREALAAIGNHGPQALRNRAILLVGFHGAFRRSEIASLDIEDLRFEREGVVITLRSSKTDQEAAGREVPLLTMPPSICPIRALRQWIAAAGIESGALFRTFSLSRELTANRIDPYDVARIVQKATKGAELAGDFAGHSLRSGFCTEAATRKVPLDQIARISGHKSSDILLGYIRRATPFEGAPQRAFIDQELKC
jgi:integrase